MLFSQICFAPENIYIECLLKNKQKRGRRGGEKYLKQNHRKRCEALNVTFPN